MTAPDVTVTATAKSKAHRMFSPTQLREHARAAWHGDRLVYRAGDHHEYHALVGRFAVVLRPSGDTLVVITQMHQHDSYAEDPTYRPVASVKQEVLATA